MYELSSAGIEAFDVYTKSGKFAGLIVKKPNGLWMLYFNDNCTKGSTRKFQSAPAAIEFMHNRRESKGWATK